MKNLSTIIYPKNQMRIKIIFLFILFHSSLLLAQKIDVSYQNNKIIIQNNTASSLSFKITNYKKKEIISNLIIASRSSKSITYTENKDLYKGLNIGYYYSEQALQNDITIINRLIEKRKEEKIWEDLFVGLLAAADEYFTGGFFSNMKTGFDVIFETDDEERRKKALEELQIHVAKEDLKEKMSDEEKAIFEGMVAAIKSNISADRIVLFYETQKEKLKSLQPLMGRGVLKSVRLIERYTRNKFSISASIIDDKSNPNDSLDYSSPSNSYKFNGNTPFRVRLNFDHYYAENKELNLSFGAYAGINKYPEFIFRNEKISLFSPTLGGSGKIVIGNSFGISGGIDVGVAYNSLSNNSLLKSELNKFALNYAAEISIFTPVIIFNAGLDANQFNRTDEENYDYLSSWYFGLEIPLKTKRTYGPKIN